MKLAPVIESLQIVYLHTTLVCAPRDNLSSATLRDTSSLPFYVKLYTGFTEDMTSKTTLCLWLMHCLYSIFKSL
jgi:hypothetical protein